MTRKETCGNRLLNSSLCSFMGLLFIPFLYAVKHYGNCLENSHLCTITGKMFGKPAVIILCLCIRVEWVSEWVRERKKGGREREGEKERKRYVFIIWLIHSKSLGFICLGFPSVLQKTILTESICLIKMYLPQLQSLCCSQINQFSKC